MSLTARLFKRTVQAEQAAQPDNTPQPQLPEKGSRIVLLLNGQLSRNVYVRYRVGDTLYTIETSSAGNSYWTQRHINKFVCFEADLAQYDRLQAE